MPVLQSQNTLQGALPQDSTLVSLKVLDVSRNQLTGAVPLLQHSSNLQVALFSHNQFSGSVPAPPPMNQLGTKCEDSLLACLTVTPTVTPTVCAAVCVVSVLLCLCLCVCLCLCLQPSLGTFGRNLHEPALSVWLHHSLVTQRHCHAASSLADN